MLISCESKPDVASTPIQQKKSHRYIRRRFGFLYHGTLSSSTKRVTIGSAAVPTFTIVATLDESCKKIWTARVGEEQKSTFRGGPLQLHKQFSSGEMQAPPPPPFVGYDVHTPLRMTRH